MSKRKVQPTAPVLPDDSKGADLKQPAQTATAKDVKPITATAPTMKRSPAQILDDLVQRNIEAIGAKGPFKIVRSEIGHFIAINNRPGKLALIVQGANGIEFKLGKTQAKRLGIPVPSKGALAAMSASAK